MKIRLHLCLLSLASMLAGPALAQISSLKADVNVWRNDNLPEEGPWVEKEIPLPPFPKEEDLLEFYVGPNVSNRFFIDKTSINPGEDGVVRYTLVVLTSGGATNVTYEGIRCDAGQMKTYGIGHSDGTWVKPRNLDWKAIENKPVNRHHAALRMEYFCTQGIIRNQAEGVAALKRGPQR